MPVASFLSFSTAFSAWNTSAPMRSPSRNDAAPTGITMNSWKSTLLSARAPPLRMYIIGTRSRRACAADPAPQRHADLVGGRARDGEAAAEDRVGAELLLVLRAVGLLQQVVD